MYVRCSLTSVWFFISRSFSISFIAALKIALLTHIIETTYTKIHLNRTCVYVYGCSPFPRKVAEKKEEAHLIQTIAATIRTYNYHSTAYINRKYARVL